jgi:hypothetical protein
MGSDPGPAGLPVAEGDGYGIVKGENWPEFWFSSEEGLEQAKVPADRGSAQSIPLVLCAPDATVRRKERVSGADHLRNAVQPPCGSCAPKLTRPRFHPPQCGECMKRV